MKTTSRLLSIFLLSTYIIVPTVMCINSNGPNTTAEEVYILDNTSRKQDHRSKTIRIKTVSETDFNEPILMSVEDMELIALVTMAEAEGECEEGKRLVIDTILNRVDHELFPNTVTEVIYQEGQFSCMWNGRSDRCYVKDDICELVQEEIRNRTDSNVMFFTAGGYNPSGYPMYSVGNHYFSGY